MCERVPNLDLRFFVTSVCIQRTTGGDLAEILDKIGYVIRERFRILGEPLRIRLLQALIEKERTVGELVELVGSTQPNVSKHLRILQEAGIVGRRP